MTAVDVILDLRQWPRRVRDVEGLTALWSEVERALDGTDLCRGPDRRVPLREGVVGVRLARAAAGSAIVRADTLFRLVNVLENAPVRQRCQACGDAEGVFRCAGCGDGGWLCATHAVVLDGALVGTCKRHRPGCARCDRPATFRCTGPTCADHAAYCERHRMTPASDPTVAYCPTCYGQSFPECSATGCRNIGGAACEHTDDRLGACGTRMCLTHLRRWQVYGPQRMGLALCGKHEAALAKLPPAGLVHRIVAGTFARSVCEPRSDPLPTLRGFEYTLRNFRHFAQADDPRWIHRTLRDAGGAFTKAPDGDKLAAFVRQRDEGVRGREGWRKELQDQGAKDGQGRDLLRQARQILQAAGGDGARLAADLGFGGYVAARGGDDPRPALLFLAVPDAQHRAFQKWRARLGQELSMRTGVETVVRRHQGEGRVS